MNTHPYLRAYLAGICVPTIFLLFVATGFTFIRYVYNFPVPIERVIVFPMAVVPNLWGCGTFCLFPSSLGAGSQLASLEPFSLCSWRRSATAWRTCCNSRFLRTSWRPLPSAFRSA